MSGELRVISVPEVVRIVHYAETVLDMTPVGHHDDIEIG